VGEASLDGSFGAVRRVVRGLCRRSTLRDLAWAVAAILAPCFCWCALEVLRNSRVGDSCSGLGVLAGFTIGWLVGARFGTLRSWLLGPWLGALVGWADLRLLQFTCESGWIRPDTASLIPTWSVLGALFVCLPVRRRATILGIVACAAGADVLSRFMAPFRISHATPAPLLSGWPARVSWEVLEPDGVLYCLGAVVLVLAVPRVKAAQIPHDSDPGARLPSGRALALGGWLGAALAIALLARFPAPPDGVIARAGSDASAPLNVTFDRAEEVLRRRFEDSGFELQSDYFYARGGVEFFCTGFDPDARVGFVLVDPGEPETGLDVDDESRLHSRAAAGEEFVLVLRIDSQRSARRRALVQHLLHRVRGAERQAATVRGCWAAIERWAVIERWGRRSFDEQTARFLATVPARRSR